MTLDQKNFDPVFDLVVVVLKPFNYLPWSSRPKKTFQHIFGLAPFGLKIFDLKIFGVEKFGLAAPSRVRFMKKYRGQKSCDTAPLKNSNHCIK